MSRKSMHVLVTLGLIATVAGCIGGDLPGDEQGAATGVALSLDLRGTAATIEGVRFEFKPCGSKTWSTHEQSLEELLLPGGLGEFIGRPFDGDSEHLFSDFFTVLGEGCYDVRVVPLGLDGYPLETCSIAEVTGLTVHNGKTTEVLLISQCEGVPRGGLDIIASLNHPPLLRAFTYSPSKFVKCPSKGFTRVTFCATAEDPDNDPLEFDWLQHAGPLPKAGPNLVSRDKEDGKTTECVEFVLPNTSADYEFEVIVYDLLKGHKGSVHAEAWFVENGYGAVESRDTLKFPLYVSCKKDYPPKDELDVGGIIVDVGHKEPRDVGGIIVDVGHKEPRDVGGIIVDVGHKEPRDVGGIIVDVGHKEPRDVGGIIVDVGHKEPRDVGGIIIDVDDEREKKPPYGSNYVAAGGGGSCAVGAGGGSGSLLGLGLLGLMFMFSRRRSFKRAARRPFRPGAAFGAAAAVALMSVGMLLMVSLSPAAAQAQERVRGHVPTQQFQPMPGTQDGFTILGGAKTLDNGQFAIGHYLNYAHRTLILSHPSGRDRIDLIQNHLQADLVAAIGLWANLEMGVGIPLTLYLASESSRTMPQIETQKGTLGDIRLYPKWNFYKSRLARQGDLGLRASLLAVKSLPTGHLASMQGNSGVTFEPRLVVDYAFVPGRLGAQLGYLMRPRQELYNIVVGNEWTYGFAYEHFVLPRRWSLTVELHGKLAGEAGIEIVEENSPLELLFGMRFFERGGHGLDVSAGPGLTAGYGTPLWRAAIGYTFTMPQRRGPGAM